MMAFPALAQTSFPMITHAYPVALQRGTTTEIAVDGQMKFAGAYKALFEVAGISAEVTSPPPVPGTLLKSVKMKTTIAKDAPLGVREFRIATSLGVSSVGQLLIVDDPIVMEKPANNLVAQAQDVKLPCTLVGKLEVLEDLDYFKFDAKEGETITFEMFCARIQDKIHDLQKHAKPMLTLFDGEGRELAANDTFFFADPMLAYIITKTGAYYLQVRESTYDGDQRWVYAIAATNRPYVSHVFPMAGNPGKTIDVEPIGSARAIRDKFKLLVPDAFGVQQIQLGFDPLTPDPSPAEGRGGKLNPASFIVSNLPQFVEVEPNDEPAKANRVTIPAGVNGRIGKKRDADHYVFAATKGKPIRMELKARRFGTLLNSSLHGILEVITPKGDLVASNDTTHGQEASLVFSPAADADFILRVRDLNSKGSESSVYFVEMDWATPDFTVRCDPDKTMIGPGSSTSWYVHVNRVNGFAGPVDVTIKGLPKEVTASPLTIPPTMTQGVIVLAAAANAGLNAANVEIVGTAKAMIDGKEQTLVRGVTPNQEIYLPGGGRGRFDVNLQTVAVTSPSDIRKVLVSANNVTLKPGQEVKINVTIERSPEYDKGGVFLDVLLQHLGAVIGNPLPPGVTVVLAKSKTLLGNASKGHIVLKADASAAPVDNVPICVIANVSINFVVKIHYASEPILVSVKK